MSKYRQGVQTIKICLYDKMGNKLTHGQNMNIVAYCNFIKTLSILVFIPDRRHNEHEHDIHFHRQ